jgi:hypothetical protein
LQHRGPMDTTAKIRENKARRAARRQGYELRKSRRRDPLAIDYGTYGLVDRSAGNSGVLVAGGETGYGMTLDDVEGWLNPTPYQELLAAKAEFALKIEDIAARGDEEDAAEARQDLALGGR